MRWIMFVLAGALVGLAAESWGVGERAEKGERGASPAGEEVRFRWTVASDGVLDLVDDGRRVLRYMHSRDMSTPERAHETYKCYHHVFDGEGENLLTKGPGGLYTHHRGLFIGWNRLTVGEKEYDFWHMKTVTQRHAGTVEMSAGADRARQAVLIHWCDEDGGVIIIERRELTIHRGDGSSLLLLDFQSELTAKAGDVLLNGDPEHAGFQFRAHNDVADGPADVKAKYLFHDDGVDPTKDLDLPWVAMSFGLNGKRYCVQHMNHPANASPSIYSAYRDYGRFGAFAKTEVKAGETLTLRYRIWVAEGDLPSREVCRKYYEAYVQEAREGAGQEE